MLVLIPVFSRIFGFRNAFFTKGHASSRLFNCKRPHNAFSSICQPFARVLSAYIQIVYVVHVGASYIACSDFLCKKSEFARAAALPFSQKSHTYCCDCVCIALHIGANALYIYTEQLYKTANRSRACQRVNSAFLQNRRIKEEVGYFSV